MESRRGKLQCLADDDSGEEAVLSISRELPKKSPKIRVTRAKVVPKGTSEDFTTTTGFHKKRGLSPG